VTAQRGWFDSHNQTKIDVEKIVKILTIFYVSNRVLSLIEKFLKQGVLENLTEIIPEEGTPQGAVISPLLSNIYLNRLDHLMAEQGYKMVRYADALFGFNTA